MGERSGAAERSTDGVTTARAGLHPRRTRRFPWFDVLGGLAVAAFVAVILLDMGALGRPREEVSLHVDPEALAEGFREGVQWYGLYRGENKVGFSRMERRRRDDGYTLGQQIHLRPGQGPGPTQLSVDTELDLEFALQRFTVEVQGGPLPLTAVGERRGDTLHIEADGLPGGGVLDLPLAEPPVFDFSLGPLVMRNDLEPGDRFSFTHVDPLALTPAEGTLEYLGRDSLDVLGERVSAFHLRQLLPGMPPLELWVNALGEVLQQQLPLELVAVREPEAEATYGLTAPGLPAKDTP